MQRTTIADPALDAVVPVTPRWRAALGVGIGVALLVAAAASASVLRPGAIPGSTSGGAQGAPPGVLTTIELEGASAWQRVESVTGPGVADAWLTADDPLDGGQSQARPLPVVLHRGERMWLVIRWSDPCGTRAAVRTVGLLGNVREEQLPDGFAAGDLSAESVSGATCAGGS